jgi:hypothetical protein
MRVGFIFIFLFTGKSREVQGAGYKVQGRWYMIQGAGCKVQGRWYMLQGARCKSLRVKGVSEISYWFLVGAGME